MRICKGCKDPLDESCFRQCTNDRGYVYLKGKCMRCERIAKSKYDSNRSNKRNFLDYNREVKYGKTRAELEKMLSEQDGKCKISTCQKILTLETGYVDHCHSTGTVRA